MIWSLITKYADVAKLVDALHSECSAREGVGVQLPPSAPRTWTMSICFSSSPSRDPLRGHCRVTLLRISINHASVAQLDQSAGLRNRRSEVRVLPGVPIQACVLQQENAVPSSGRARSDREVEGSRPHRRPCRRTESSLGCHFNHRARHDADVAQWESAPLVRARPGVQSSPSAPEINRESGEVGESRQTVNLFFHR